MLGEWHTIWYTMAYEEILVSNFDGRNGIRCNVC